MRLQPALRRARRRARAFQAGLVDGGEICALASRGRWCACAWRAGTSARCAHAAAETARIVGRLIGVEPYPLSDRYTIHTCIAVVRRLFRYFTYGTGSPRRVHPLTARSAICRHCTSQAYSYTAQAAATKRCTRHAQSTRPDRDGMTHHNARTCHITRQHDMRTLTATSTHLTTGHT